MSEKQDTKRNSKSHNDRYFHETDDSAERGTPYKRDAKWKQQARESYFNVVIDGLGDDSNETND